MDGEWEPLAAYSQLALCIREATKWQSALIACFCSVGGLTTESTESTEIDGGKIRGAFVLLGSMHHGWQSRPTDLGCVLLFWRNKVKE